MNIRNRSRTVTLALVLSTAALSTATAAEAAQEATIQVAADKPGPAISPMLYGLMTEEINHSYDGGLYTELVRNRTVRGRWDGPEGWLLVQRGNAKASM